jgi:NADPH:quinone reductase-like Zn-dependent oxidoreductase
LVVVPRLNVFPKPEELSFERSVAVGIPFLTAWHMLVDRAQLVPGETVLVQAGGSGVGSAATQIARLWGATVITTVGSDAKAARARELGADHVINYQTSDVARQVKSLTAGRGVDVIVDHVGAATWDGSIRSLAWHGRYVTCGATVGAEVQLNLRQLFFKALSLLGSTMGSKAEFGEVLSHAAAGRLTPVIDRTLPLSEAREAHRLLEERQAFGKIVLAV